MPARPEREGELWDRFCAYPGNLSWPAALSRLSEETAEEAGRDERQAIVKWLRNAAKARPAIINPDYLEHFAINIESGAHGLWRSRPSPREPEAKEQEARPCE